jgi:acetylornithine/succinyldiaminopimelate/putrescine aminotransferase
MISLTHMGLNPGVSKIIAKYKGMRGSTKLTVSKTEEPLVSITVLPPNPVVSTNKFVQFAAIGNFVNETMGVITETVVTHRPSHLEQF